MCDRQMLFKMANRLHYQADLSRSAALTVAWNLIRIKEPEYTKARGVSFDGRQEILKKLARRGLMGITTRLEREPGNLYDEHAIRVVLVHEASGRSFSVGYLSRDRADRMAPLLDAGLRVDVLQPEVTGGLAYQVAGVA